MNAAELLNVKTQCSQRNTNGDVNKFCVAAAAAVAAATAAAAAADAGVGLLMES